jgi:hypothetical protein
MLSYHDGSVASRWSGVVASLTFFTTEAGLSGSTGTNVREGRVYAGPIDIPGDGEVVIYAYAEDQGESIAKNFTIRARSGGKASRQYSSGFFHAA